jgi:hypothetical protein
VSREEVEEIISSDTVFFHGTTANAWSEEGAGCDGGLYITTFADDAANYAEEAAISEVIRLEVEGKPTDGVQAILVTLPAAEVYRLLDDGCAAEPDWGWINGLGAVGTVPGWKESYRAIVTIHLADSSHRHKTGLDTKPISPPPAATPSP